MHSATSSLLSEGAASLAALPCAAPWAWECLQLHRAHPLASPSAAVCQPSRPQVVKCFTVLVLRCSGDAAVDGGAERWAHGERELETLSCQVVHRC